MPNHFHLLIRIKSETEIGIYKDLNSGGSNDSVRFQTEQNAIKTCQSAKLLTELMLKSQIRQNIYRIFLTPIQNTSIKNISDQEVYSKDLLRENRLKTKPT